MNLFRSIRVGVLLLLLAVISCRDAGRMSVSALLAEIAPSVDVQRRWGEWTVPADSIVRLESSVALSLPDGSGFDSVRVIYGAQSGTPLPDAMPTSVNLWYVGAQPDSMRDDARSRLVRLLQSPGTDGCIGDSSLRTRITSWQLADGIVVLQDSEGRSLGVHAPLVRLLVSVGASSVRGALGIAPNPETCM
jgi:hypothetical protein